MKQLATFWDTGGGEVGIDPHAVVSVCEAGKGHSTIKIAKGSLVETIDVADPTHDVIDTLNKILIEFR